MNFGQNLVTNASFKEFSSCPTSFGQITANGWWIPTVASTDYFNECSTTNLSVPSNAWGYQPSTTGAYVGVNTFYTTPPGMPDVNYREYAQAALLESTVEGACYELSITYSPADEYSYSNGLGVLLSDEVPTVYLGQVAQLQKSEIVEDPTLWHTLSDYYISPGGESYMTIGNFNDDQNTSYVPNGIFMHAAFYYVDSVSVNFIGFPSDLSVDLGEDVILCESEFPYTITSSIPDATNIWNTGEVGSSIEVDEPGIYYVVSNIQCDSGTDTIEIELFDEPILDMPDTLICAGSSVVFEFDPELGDFEWNNGSTESSITITEAGAYTLTVTHFCGEIIEGFEVSVLDPVEIPILPDLELCATELPILIDLSELDNGTNSFSWLSGEVSSVIELFTDGLFSVTVSNDCFADEMDFQIEISNPIPLIENFPDTSACPNQQIVINPNFDDVVYIWQDGSDNPYYVANGPGIYTLTVSNFCGLNIFEFEIDPIIEETLILGDDAALCPGDSVYISGLNDEVISWSTGEVSLGIWVKSDNTIVGTTLGPCGLLADTIDISFGGSAPTFDLPQSLTICEGDSIVVSASTSTSGIDFEWSNGSVDSEILVTEPGNYYLVGSNGCGSTTDSVTVLLFEPLYDLNLEALHTICSGDTLTVFIESNATTIEWSNGSQDSFIDVFEDGLYYVSVTNDCSIKVDSFELQLEALLAPFTLEENLALCSGEIIDIAAPIYNGNYLWSTGEETTVITVDAPGNYWLVVEGTCNVISDTLTIEDLGTIPNIDLGSDLLICLGDTAVISVEGNDNIDDIIWNDGSTIESIEITEAGTYIVMGSNICGTTSDTIVAQINTVEPQIDLGIDQVLCVGDSLTLDLSNFQGEILWSTGEISPEIVVQNPGEYYATLSSSCGESSDTILVGGLAPPALIELAELVSICEGEVYQIELDVLSTTTILWNSGSTESEQLFIESGFYWVDISNFCGLESDSFTLEIIPEVESFSLPEDQLICDASSYVIESGITQLDIDLEWSTGENTFDIEAFASEIYWLKASNDCFTSQDSIELIFANSPSPFDLGIDDTICFGETIVLEGFQGDNVQYVWQNNDNSSEFVVTESGIYSLEVETICGIASDEIEIVVLPSESINNGLKDKYLLCIDEPLVIDLSELLVDGILWNDGSSEKIREFVDVGAYQVQLFNICTDTLVNFIFDQQDCTEGNVYVPNTFTPNNDGINDLFYIHISEHWEVKSFYISVYSRWGEQVFSADEIDFGWDGTFKGKPLNPAVYAFHVIFEVIIDGESQNIQINGDVTIIK